MPTIERCVHVLGLKYDYRIYNEDTWSSSDKLVDVLGKYNGGNRAVKIFYGHINIRRVRIDEEKNRHRKVVRKYNSILHGNEGSDK